ncbi:GL25956 [Drosophila persimilis]|uniref:GL25956 n=1 Tax=Drosophila persimilis TaxID=7234 RepID=B4GJW1_DROPE|nr:GL25956 [Drosophila persimilis]
MNKSTLNTLRDPPEPSGKDTTVWSKSGPLSTVLKNAIESLLPIETRRGELAKAAMQQNFSSKLLKRHRVEQQILAPNTMETRGTTTQRLMALMQYNITQMASPFGYETSDLASRYARLGESHHEEDQRDQSKPNRRVRDIHPPRESATLPEGKKEQKSVGQQQQQQSLKDRQLEYIDNLIHIASTKQKIEGHEEPNRRARDMLPPLEEEKAPSIESTTLGETNWQKKQHRDSHIDIASIKQKIKQLVEKKLQKDQKVPKKESQGKQSDYEHIPSQRTARVTKSPERAKKTKKLLKIGSNPEIRSKMFPTKRMKKQTPGPSTGRDL